jgi:hypothetical protein
MATLRSHVRGAWSWLTGSGGAATAPTQAPNRASTAGPNTGPLDPHAANAARVRERVESFEEDRESPLGSVVLSIVYVACYTGPLIMAVFVARILAGVLSGPGVDPVSMFLICLIAELIQAGCALALPRGIIAFRRDPVKRSVTIAGVAVFLFLVASSVLAQYIALVAGKQPTLLAQVMIALRAGLPVVADLGATVVLVLLRKKTLQRFLEETEKKEDAITRVSLAELRLQEAEQEAAMREKERTQYLEGKDRVNNLIVRLQEVQNAAIIRMVEEAADGTRGTGGQRRYGSY